MPFNSESQIIKKIRNALSNRGYSITEQPTMEIDNNPLMIDLFAELQGNIFLIEVNNGIRVGMNDISQLLRFSNELKKTERKKIHEVIITDYLDKVDPEVKKITDKEKIKIMTVENLECNGFPN